MIGFAAPVAAAFAAVALLIVAQYFLKLRRARKTVPSTLLWNRAAIDTRANAPWQRLRAEPLLILQLVVLLAITLALMKPYVLRAGALGSDVVIVLDASLSTQTVDGGQTRFAREVSAARALVNNLPQDKSVSLVRLDGRPRVLVASSTDRGAVQAVLSGERPGFEQPDVASAMDLAFALAMRAGTGQVAVDLLRSSATSVPALPQSIAFRDLRFGSQDSPNLGVDSLVASQTASGKVAASFRVANTGRTALESDVELVADGRVEAVEPVAVPAQKSTVMSTMFLSKPVSVLEARLTLKDALPADNATWTLLQAQSARHVLLVTSGDMFLVAALGTATDTVVATTTPKAYDSALVRDQDLVVFDGYVPPSLPATNLMFIGPPHDTLGLHVGSIRTAGPMHVDDDPNGLLTYFSTSDVHVFKARSTSMPAWAHAALRDGRGALLLEGSVGGANGRRAVVTLFDLGQSDLPLSFDFPVLISNLINWLAPIRSADMSVIHPGALLTVTLPSDQARVTVTGPDGSEHDLLPITTDQGGEQAVFSATDLPGPYKMRVSSGPVAHVAHFVVDPVLEPIGGVSVAAVGVPPRAAPGSSGNAKIPVELTRVVALLAVGALAAEWLVAMRLQ